MPAVSNVLIVGGGISGMALALELKRAGIRADIVEINPQWSVLGVGIALGGPALRALSMIGVLDQCVERGFGYSHFKACNADGQVTGTVRLHAFQRPRLPRQPSASCVRPCIRSCKTPWQRRMCQFVWG